MSQAETWRSSLYPPDWTPPLGLSFAKDKLIQDFSYAGYRRGEAPIPEPNGNILNAVSQYGADPSGKSDSTAAIQKALDAAGKAGGGVVLLPTGTFRISLPRPDSKSVLRISSNNTILRGSGEGKTFLLNHSTVMRSSSIILVRGNDRTAPLLTSPLTKDVLTPVHRLHVANASHFKVGDLVGVRWNFTDAWIAEHGQSQVWQEGAEAPAPAMYQREVMAVNASEGWIETDIPARYYHLIRDKARVEKYNSRIQESGIENLSIGNVQHPGKGWQSKDYEVPGTGGHDVHASWVINFSRARNCWVRNVHSYQAVGNSSTCHLLSNGIQIGVSSNVTLLNCSMKRPQYGGGGGNGYMFRLTNGNDCLVENCLADFSRHGFVNSHAGSSGNVFHKCVDRNTRSSTGDTGYVQTDGDGSDNHMHFSHSSLWDQCHAHESWWEAVHRGWNYQALASAHCVYWNTSGSGSAKINGGKIVRSGQARYGYVIGTHGEQHGIELRKSGNSLPLDVAEGEGKGRSLSPSSLYQDQLSRRLGAGKHRIWLISKGVSEPGAEIDFLVKIDGLGKASSGSDGMEVKGETYQADFFNSKFGIRLEAIKRVSAAKGAVGSWVKAGTLDRDSAGCIGVAGSPGGSGLAADACGTEGIRFGLSSLTAISPESQVQLHQVIVRWLGVGESVTVANQLTGKSINLKGSAATYPEVAVDVSQLGVIGKVGQMKELAVIFPDVGSSMRIGGVCLELGGESEYSPSQAALTPFPPKALHSASKTAQDVRRTGVAALLPGPGAPPKFGGKLSLVPNQ